MKHYHLVLFLSIGINAFGQFDIAFKAGLVSNYINASIPNQTFTEINKGNGYDFSLMLQYNYKKTFVLKSGFEVLQKKYSFIRNGIYNGAFKKVTNNYLQLPIIFSYKVYQTKKIEVSAEAGAYLGYWLSSLEKVRIPNLYSGVDTISSSGIPERFINFESYSKNYVFDSDKDRRIETGLIWGLILVTEVTNRFHVFLEPLLYTAFTSQQKQHVFGSSIRNRSLSLSIGIKYKIQKLVL